MEPNYWVHDLSPIVVRCYGPIAIRYYGLAYVLAFAVAVLLLRLYWRTGRSPLNQEAQRGAIAAISIGVVLGGRIGYFLLYAPASVTVDPLSVLRVWEGGMASHGGFAGCFLALIWTARKYKVDWRPLADVMVTLAPPGFFFGRVANFINGELWGKVSYLPWSVIFPASVPPGTPLGDIPPRHPSQLYEALLEGVVLGIFVQARFWFSKSTRTRAGRIAAEFLIAYGILRVMGELYREPDAPLIFGFSRGIFYSFIVILGGVIVAGMVAIRVHASKSVCADALTGRTHANAGPQVETSRGQRSVEPDRGLKSENGKSSVTHE